MGKVQLMFVAVLTAAVFSASGAELPLPLMLDCSKPDAVRKLEREIRERKYNDALEIYNLQNNVIPELPKHEFRTISISNRNNSGAVDLTPLAGHTPKILSLFSGTFTNLASLETAKIEDLSANFETVLYADDLSRGDWSALRRLHLSGAKGIFLNLKSAVGLESLELHCGNTDITICLSPQVRLKTLWLSGQSSLLQTIHTEELAELSIYSPRMTDHHRLPSLPKLKILTLDDFPAVSLKHIRTQCPALEGLWLYQITQVIDWEELPSMPLKKLHVYDCGGAKWSLPVDPPPGCEVTGLPSFTENPYKMWSTWAILTALFGLWTLFWQKRMRRASQKEEVK